MHPTLNHLARLCLPLVFALSGCGAVASPTTSPATAYRVSTEAPTQTGKLKVIATFSFMGDLVRNVAGDSVDLLTLVGPEGDTHEYEPIPSDSVALAGADVIFENGLGFELWLDNLYAASGSKAVRVVTSEGVTTRKVEADGQMETDPHTWQNVDNAMVMVKNIEAALTKTDPAHAAIYTANAKTYLSKLAALGKAIEAEVATLPHDRRKLVTSHDALGYYADRYGFEIVGNVIASISTEAGEPSAADFARLVDAIKATGTQAIFLESIGNPALVERVAREAGVVVGPPLYTDALGQPGSEGGTYIDALRHNTEAIVKALAH